ncbi:MAG: CotH kinase family protein [Acidimicrobiales bacterium]|nr:CotH kinase family protein [Acidimicrobiales bacterium]|tara:strand:- start:6977 stop:8365 length:1389 start_codon:yes stop_codon:yes gene_type:complete
MVKRVVTSIITVAVLLGVLVACGGSDSELAELRADLEELEEENNQKTTEVTEITNSAPEPIIDNAPESVHSASQFDESTDALLPIAQISIILDGAINPDELPYQREWMPASMMVIADDGIAHQGRVGLHVRGNTSRDFDKKSYAFETWDENDEDLDVTLLGLPAEEDWVLQGPFSDKTLIRNHLIYQLSRDIGRYAARTRFVELEINGDYRGVYVLMEKIKRDDVRVALPDGAALLKRDWVEGGEKFIQTTACQDELKVEWSDDIDEIVTRLDSIEAELLIGDFSSVDLGSFIDHMLLVEIGRNVDGYVLSTWITLSENDVLGMGPVWDYNGALGNASYFRAWETNGWHYQNPEFPGDNPNGFCWYEVLLENPEFLNLRRERWQIHRAGPWSDAAIEARIDGAIAVLEPAIERNFERWPLLGEVIWPNDLGAEDRTTYVDEVSYLKSWIKQRMGWMDLALSP